VFSLAEVQLITSDLIVVGPIVLYCRSTT